MRPPPRQPDSSIPPAETNPLSADTIGLDGSTASSPWHNDERHRRLIEGVRDYALFAMDLQGRIIIWSPGVQHLLGYSQEEFVGQPGEIIFTPEDRESGAVQTEFSTAARSGHASNEGWALRKDGSQFFSNGILTALHSENGTLHGYCKIVRDMTVQKRIEQEKRLEHTLELSQANQTLRKEIEERNRHEAEREKLLKELETERHRLEQVLQQLPAGVILAEAPSGRLTFINAKARQIFGGSTPLSESIGDYGMWRLLDAEGNLLRPDESPMARAILEGKATQSQQIKFEKTDKTIISVSTNAAPIRDGNGRIVAGVAAFEDITERSAHEAARRQLLQRIVDTQEEERRRIAYELDDHFNQKLTALLVGLDSLSSRSNSSDDAHLSRLRGIAADLMQQMNYLAWDLRPATLDTLGLEATLRQFLIEWSQTNGIQADFISRGFKSGWRLPTHLENTFYRVVQETLSNVLQHANASCISVILECTSEQAAVIIEDDGHGFNTKGVARFSDGQEKTASQLGLIGMRERMELANGSFDIESAVGKGTTVYARAPLNCKQPPC